MTIYIIFFILLNSSCVLPSKTFTRLAEQVLAANKKDLDLLRISINDEINLTALEEEEGLGDSVVGDQGKSCWC